MNNFSLNARWLLVTAVLFCCLISSCQITPKLPSSFLREGWKISKNDTINKLYPGAIYLVHPMYGKYLLPKSEIKLADDNTLKINIPHMWGYSVNVKHLSVADTSKWHPEAIYIILPNRKLTFRLHHEKDQDPSGVANLLFQCKESGKIHLHDTIKGGYRSFNVDLLSGEYDAILLYNSGKYIRYNNVGFEKNADKEVEMQKLNIQQPDAASRYWLTLRAFNTPTRERIYHRRSYPTVSEKKIRGYVYNHQDGFQFWPGPVIFTVDSAKWTRPYFDGYFEFDVDPNQLLKIMAIGYIIQEIKITESCGLVVWMEEVPIDPNFNPIAGQL